MRVPNTISFPTTLNEFDIQVYIWEQLKAHGFIPRGEFGASCVDYDGEEHICIFDIVAFHPKTKEALAIFEAKKPNKRVDVSKSKQGRRYRLFGIPIFPCQSLSDVDKSIQQMQDASTSITL